MRRLNAILYTASFLLLAAGCGSDGSPADDAAPFEVLENDAIPGEIHAEIVGIENQLFDSFESADSTFLRELLSETVVAQVETGPGLDTMFAAFQARLTGTGMVPIDDFHITVTGSTENPVHINASTDQPFEIDFVPPGNEVYVSLREITGGVRTRLLGLIYAREEDRWRLHTLRLGALRASRRTALEWFEEAKGLDSVGRALPAMLRLNIAGDLLRPVPFLRYPNEQEVLDLLERVGTDLEAAHSFPLEISESPGTPAVLSFEPIFLGETLTPMVAYTTGVTLDEASIKEESAKLLEQLETTFLGICDGVSRVAFTAYSERPTDPNVEYASIGVFSDCKK